jgi:hypothetical protein
MRKLVLVQASETIMNLAKLLEVEESEIIDHLTGSVLSEQESNIVKTYISELIKENKKKRKDEKG